MSHMMNVLIISYICHSLFPELDLEPVSPAPDDRLIYLLSLRLKILFV